MANLMQRSQDIGRVPRLRTGSEIEGSVYLSSDLQAEFTRSYNRRSFGFSHGLGDHALFSLPNLVALASRLEDNNRNYCSSGKIDVSDGWSTGEQVSRSLADVVSRIESNDSLVMLKGVTNDRLMGPVLREVSDRLIELAGPALRDDLIAARATILIASPDRITAYHADADVNFLMQVSGDKLFNVFDQTDRSLVTEDEVERFFTGEERAIRFLPERQQDAFAYELSAGRGVHVPCLAPHWARTRDAVSVAVSFNFDLGSIKRLASVHKVNHQLRRLGLHPYSPGDHEWRDQIKYGGAQAILAARSLIRNLPLKHRSPVTGT